MVKLENVKKSYKDFTLELSMEIPKGSIIGLVGEKGAGKTTIIKLITGLSKADAGEITVFDKSIKNIKAIDKELIGVALQEACFNKEFTLKDIAKILSKMYLDFDKEKFEKECKSKKLPNDKKIAEFSTGMRARLRLLIAMSHNAKLLLLDEPTTGLDVEARTQIIDMVRDYKARDEEITILITAENSSEIADLCDNIYILHKGKILRSKGGEK